MRQGARSRSRKNTLEKASLLLAVADMHSIGDRRRARTQQGHPACHFKPPQAALPPAAPRTSSSHELELCGGGDAEDGLGAQQHGVVVQLAVKEGVSAERAAVGRSGSRTGGQHSSSGREKGPFFSPFIPNESPPWLETHEKNAGKCCPHNRHTQAALDEAVAARIRMPGNAGEMTASSQALTARQRAS